LADDAVLTANITDANVTTAKIAADAITGAKIADDAINSEHYTDGSIDTAHIADANVTTAKIADDAITTAKIADDVALGGNPTTTTQSAGNNTTRIATTAFVTTALSSVSSALDDITAGDAAATLATTAGNITIDAQGSDTDIIFKGTDGSSDLTALTLDMSEAGAATFAGNVKSPRFILNGTDSATTRYIFTDNTNTGDGRLVIQSGGGSAGYGGAINLYSHAHSSKAGDVVAGISSGSSGAFRVNTSGIDNGSDVFVVKADGNVGIGTTSPSDYNDYANNLVVYEAGHGGITIATGTSNHASIYFADGTSGNEAYRGYLDYDHSDDTLEIGTGGAAVAEFGTGTSATTDRALVVTNYGNVGFGVRPQYYGSNRYIDAQSGANGECLFELRGHNGSGGKFGIRGGVSTGGMGMISNHTLNFLMNQSSVGTLDTSGVLNIDVNDTSDEGLKENVISIADGTTVIKALRPVAFDWKEITAKNEKGEDTVKPARTGQHGFLAQEVESVLPNAIQGTDWVEGKHFAESKSMNSNAVLAHAVKAIQEQQTIIEDLKARIETLEG
jgi:hypothetical protein